MGYGLQCEIFGCESLLADSSYTDLCSCKYDEREGFHVTDQKTDWGLDSYFGPSSLWGVFSL